MKEEKNNIDISYWIGIVMIIGFIVYSVYSIRESKNSYPLEKQRYYEESFTGILKRKWLNRGIIIIIESNNYRSKNYLYSSKNYNYTPSSLYSFIARGDSLVKLPNSYDLYIYRKDSKYYFKLGEYINK